MKYYSEPMSVSDLRLERDDLTRREAYEIERIAYHQSKLEETRARKLELAVIIGYVQGKGLA